MSISHLDQLRRPVTEEEEPVDRVPFRFQVARRDFLQLCGAGLLIAVSIDTSPGQDRGRGRGRRSRGGASTVSARLHLSKEGVITVFTGKVECGQGSRAELTQAAAEELRLSPEAVKMIMADTNVVPDDGGTAGSRTTPSTVPAIREGCAAARQVLVAAAARRWNIEAGEIAVENGAAREEGGDRTFSYADLAADEEAATALGRAIPENVELTPMGDWKRLGTSVARPNGRDIVTGRHAYPSDVVRPEMVYGMVLRPPSYGAQLVALDTRAAEAMRGVVVVRDNGFVGVTAPTSREAQQAIAALAEGAEWQAAAHPSSRTLARHLRDHARDMPVNPHEDEMGRASKTLEQTYEAAYVQHCPMEPRAAVAEWSDEGLTVWTATQMPFRVKGELVEAFRLPEDRVRVVVPDFGGGFGGKHSGECAVEAARLARAAGKPVQLRWTREEEFTWAYFRPAAVIDAEASLDEDGKLTSWHFVNINSGGNGIESPYRCGKQHTEYVRSEAPLRHGSYRSLAVTANTFAREVFMDELAEAAGQDPLAFRLAHLDEGRLREVLVAATERFDWKTKMNEKAAGHGVGLACGLDKGSVVAACAEVAVTDGAIEVTHVCQAFECGKILNPDNLEAQVHGAIIMGLGPALWEAMIFEDGKMENATFRRYRVPRFRDVPKLTIHLLDRPDLPSVGAGETPLIVVAPAVANAVFQATGQRLREMPLKLAQA